MSNKIEYIHADQVTRLANNQMLGLHGNDVYLYTGKLNPAKVGQMIKGKYAGTEKYKFQSQQMYTRQNSYR